MLVAGRQYKEVPVKFAVMSECHDIDPMKRNTKLENLKAYSKPFLKNSDDLILGIGTKGYDHRFT